MCGNKRFCLLQKTRTWDSSGEARGVEVSLHSVWQRELDLRVVELLHMRSSAFVGCNLFHTDDLNRVSTSTVTGTHVSV